MIKSMTGFGRGENSDGIHNFSVEIKTVNHRYNDIIIKMPKHLNYLEEKIKKTIKKKINRGRVEVYVNLEYISESAVDVNVDIELARAYKDGLDEITNELQIEDDVKLSHILTFSEIVKTERKEYNEDVIWNCLSESTEAALQNVVNMRVEEGIALKNDMEIQLDKLKSMIVEIEKRAPLVVEDYRNRLKSRIDELIDKDYDLDEDRLNYEVAIFADKSDINEEVIRFKSHINQFLMSLESKDPIGRKLDFIIQEMNREINTIGSKANDLTITNYVVDIKSEVEKIREQVQNVE